jgi:hypothetical protein
MGVADMVKAMVVDKIKAIETHGQDEVFQSTPVWWGLTGVYFAYVVLGGISHTVHEVG